VPMWLSWKTMLELLLRLLWQLLRVEAGASPPSCLQF
jgi:hypothetical protein